MLITIAAPTSFDTSGTNGTRGRVDAANKSWKKLLRLGIPNPELVRSSDLRLLAAYLVFCLLYLVIFKSQLRLSYRFFPPLNPFYEQSKYCLHCDLDNMGLASTEENCHQYCDKTSWIREQGELARSWIERRGHVK